jgi:hypothetical protein
MRPSAPFSEADVDNWVAQKRWPICCVIGGLLIGMGMAKFEPK